MQELIIDNKDVACVFSGKIPSTKWTSSDERKEILDYVSYLDNNLRADIDDVNDGYCSQVQKLCQNSKY